MHVLYLHQYFALPESPGGTRSYEFARRLVERGHRVTMVTSPAMLPERFATGRVERFSVEGIDVVVLPIAYANELGPAQRMAAFARFALRSVVVAARARRRRARHPTPLTIAVPGLAARVARRRPLVFEVRDLWPEAPIAMGILRNPLLVAAARGLEWAAYHGSRSVIALTDGMGDGVARRGIDRARIHVIPNASDRALFDVPEAAGEAVRARVGPRAGRAPDRLLRHVRQGQRLRVARRPRRRPPRRAARGARPARRQGRRAAADRGARAGARRARANPARLGSRAEARPPAIFSAATISVSTRIDVPELWENSANKLFDAFAAGRPVAINHGGWQQRLLEESGAGLVWPTDARAAARLTAAFVREPGRVERARAAARELAATRFDRDLLFDRFEQVLLDAAGRR